MRLLFLFTSIAAFGAEFSTAIGDTYPYTIQAMTTDTGGNTYLTGNRSLSNGVDVFVTKLDPSGAVVFTKTFGANAVGYVIAVDPSGNIYVGGNAASQDLPLVNAVQAQASNAPASFLAKLSSDGSTVIYSTYFGGTQGISQITGLAADAKGNLYVTGLTTSSDFPQTSSLPAVSLAGQGVGGVMLAQLSPTGSLVFSAIVAPRDNYDGFDSAALPHLGLDAAGNIYIAGYTNATNLPTTPGVLAATGGPGIFVAKIKPGLTGFAYLTYFGPQTINISAIAVDAAGSVYLSGMSYDPTFPGTPGTLAAFWPGANEFIAKLNPAGSALVFGTFAVKVNSLTIDAAGNIWGTGANYPSNFPNGNGWTTGIEYLVGISADGSSLLYSAEFPQGTVAQGASIDGAGLVHVAGNLGFVSAINPAAPPSMKIFTLQNGFLGSMSARVSPAEVIAIYGPGIGPASPTPATPVNNRYPTALAGVSVQVNGTKLPLLYVSSSQINAVMPMGLATNTSATIQITNNGTTTPTFPLQIVPSAGVAYSTMFNSDWSVNSSSNPAHAGSYVTLYVTGAQQNFAPLVDGQIAATAEDLCQSGCAAGIVGIYAPPLFRPLVSPELSNQPTATVLYGGAAPGAVAGISQFNIRVGTAGQGFTIPLVFYLGVTVNGAGVADLQLSVVP